METWQIVLLVLVALIAVPGMFVLLELRRTLKDLRVFLQDTGGRLNGTLDEARKTLEDLNRASASVQQGADRLRALAEDLAGFGAAVRGVTDTMRRLSDGVVGAVVGGVKSLFVRDEPPARQPENP